MRIIVAFLVGSLFSAGLVISGMTDTQKVIGFLDIFGAWDATLLLVMAGALIPMFIAWKIAKKQQRSILGDEIDLTPNTIIDKKLIIGSMMFGIGWALVGFCPGPNLASLSYGGQSSIIFFVSMLLGMWIYSLNRKTLV